MSHDHRATPSSTMTTMEITVVSTEGLDNYSSYFSRIRPFITLTRLPTHVVYHYDGGGGGEVGTRGEHIFRVPVDPTFFSDTYSCLYLHLYTKRPIVGPTQLGWCLIPPSDIGLLPHDSVRYLSYRLRTTDGSRCHVIINLSIRMQGSFLDTCQTVIGIPVTAVRRIDNGDCSISTKHHGHSKMERELKNNNEREVEYRFEFGFGFGFWRSVSILSHRWGHLTKK